jgi:hypothetical protein
VEFFLLLRALLPVAMILAVGWGIIHCQIVLCQKKSKVLVMSKISIAMVIANAKVSTLMNPVFMHNALAKNG